MTEMKKEKMFCLTPLSSKTFFLFSLLSFKEIVTSQEAIFLSGENKHKLMII